MLRIGTWNTQWTSPRTVRGKVVSASLADPDCDILCVTEGYRDILPRAKYTIDGGRDWGYFIKKERRKVILWSKRPWTNVVHFDSQRPLGGRFVTGTTETDSGLLEVVGVCIPWYNAHVRDGQKDSKPWQEHLHWLDAFGKLRYQQAKRRTIVLGDFNQRLPWSQQNEQVYNELRRAFRGFKLATAGWLAGATSSAIDHIAHTPDLIRMGDIGIWPKQSQFGRHLSDHFGLWCDFDDFDDFDLSSPSPVGKNL